MRRLVALLVAILPSLALAHGGLPISEKIIWVGDRMVVPTQWWGVFLGTDGGPWSWICEEAINKYQPRRWALAGSGTYHVTDFPGLTSSRDGGCTWVEATGEIATRQTTSVVADPADPHGAWATTASTGTPWNALFVTRDDGQSWTPTLMGDEDYPGVALSRDGKTVYVVGVPRMGPRVPTLHVSTDAGAHWSATVLDYTYPSDVDGGMPVAPNLVPLAVDPADATRLWAAAWLDPTGALLRIDGAGATVTDAWKGDSPVSGIDFDGKRGAVLVATAKLGLLRSTDATHFAATGGLSQTQCVSVHGDAVYACAWNYAPDNAAIARSDDGGMHFTRVFQYADTVGPVTSCAPSTPVATICPQVWQMYADQLGICLSDCDAGTGSDGGTPAPAPSGCGCSVGRRAPAGLAALALGALALLVLRRRRGRP